MAFHHVAMACGDLEVSHRFYTQAMGFELVHAQAGVTDAPDGTGWAKHLFYDTGEGAFLALWALNDPRISPGDLSLSRGLGLPTWVNHLAFVAPDLVALDSCQERWLETDLDVLRIDHGRTESIYTDDPDGNMIEWCCTKASFDARDASHAATILIDAAPALDPLPTAIEFFLAANHHANTSTRS